MTFAAIRGWLIAGLLVALVAAGWYVNSVFNDRADLQEKVAANQEVIRLLDKTRQATDTTLSARVRSAKAIQQKARDVQESIQTVRPDAAVELSADWRLLHDQAAAGPVPDSTSGIDGAAHAPTGHPQN